MSNQNRAGQKPKSKGGGLQAKQPSPATDVICREVKVVTVREEPLVGWEFCSAPCHIFALWRKEIMRSAWYHENKEHLVCICLDTRHQLKNFSLVSIGSLNETIAHPREVFRPAIADSAHSIMLAHNHPSNNPNPSRVDLALTRRLHAAGESAVPKNAVASGVQKEVPGPIRPDAH